MRAAYEAELNRISSAEMIIQTAVSLINIAGRRLTAWLRRPLRTTNQKASVTSSRCATRSMAPVR